MRLEGSLGPNNNFWSWTTLLVGKSKDIAHWPQFCNGEKQDAHTCT